MHKRRIMILITQLRYDGPNRVIHGILKHIDRERWEVIIGYLYGDRDYEPIYNEMGLKTVCLDMKGPLNAWVDIRVIRRLVDLLRQERIQLLHTHLVRSDIYGRIAGRIAGVPVISTIHNMERHFKGGGLGDAIVRLLDRKTIGYSRLVTTVSHSLRDYIHEAYRFPLERIHCIPNGIDPPTSRHPSITRDTVGVAKDMPLIGTVARLHEQKGVDILIDAAHIILKKGIRMGVLIVGDGPLKDELILRAGQKELGNNVRFVGFQRDVYGYLSLLDVFVLPSRWEGFGLSIIEAMATGLPVVATRVGGIPEVVEDGRTGFLVEKDDAHALADRIIYLLRNPLARREMGHRGLERYHSTFSATTMSRRYQEVYRFIEGPRSKIPI
jgi:glycosyltransferase involved in cell wall biosynthesis